MLVIINQVDSPLSKEPYTTFNTEYEAVANNPDGEKIIIEIPYSGDEKVTQGFAQDGIYGYDFKLVFSFIKNSSARNGEEEYLIRHRMEFSHDEEDYSYVVTFEKMEEISKYIYIVGAENYGISTEIGDGKAAVCFDVLTSEKDILNVCYQLISNDIMFLAKGW